MDRLLCDHVVVVIPKDDWDTLEETLTLDAESGAFDPDLRKQIRTALENLVVFRAGR